MEIKNYFAQDAQGNIMPSANCYLYLPGTTTLATGLVDGSGTPISNPFLASGMGQITFGAPNGVYDLRVALGDRDWTIKVQCADIVQAMDVMDSILGSHAENPTTRNNGQPLEPGDETWNSTDKQPYWWNGTAWVALNSSTQELEERLSDHTDPARGAGEIGRASRQIHSVAELITVPGRYHGDEVSLTAYYGGWAAYAVPNPTGQGQLTWDAFSTEAAENGKIFAVTGVDVGRWKRPGLDYIDTDYGVVGGDSGADESEAWNRLFSSVKSGRTVKITRRSRASALVCNASTVKLTTESAVYMESPAILLHAASTTPLLTVGGYGWKLDGSALEDGTVTAGGVNMGSVGVRFQRANGARDVDATISGSLFSRFDIGAHIIGINTQVNQGCVFSQCLRPVVVDQVGSEIVRGIRVKDSRFHGRPTGLIDFCVTINGTAQAEVEVTNNVADGIGGFYKGHLSRRSIIGYNQVATPAGDAFLFSGGTGGFAPGNTVGGGEGSAMILDGCANAVVDSPVIDSMFQSGIIVRNCTNWIIRNPNIFNVNLTYGTVGNIHDGVSIEATCTYGTLINPIIRQVNAQSGRYGINNQGNQTTFIGEPVVESFAVGNINQLSTQRVYGDTGSAHNKRRTEYGTTPPTSGVHGATDLLISTNVNQANPISEWECTIAGTPGIWRPTRWVVFIGLTSARPTGLRADDIGVQYMDTSLAPSGKPIWWRGSSWVDATGSAV